ncbi:MAG: type I-B CRISPR-associated protein Cas7/Cst2/DevR [Bacillota bacterium]
MAFITGTLLIDAPASALNNLGNIPGARTDNTTGVKLIRTREGAYPYVSAQAFRYWLRTTLEKLGVGWQAAPVWREEKVAYTDANPIRYWDDDLFGYMRAPSKRTSAREKREADPARADETATLDTVTRVAPFRVSTLVSLAPVYITEDFGVMARHDGDPVPFEHQFYRAALKGLFSLDLHACGTFWYRSKTGFKNLDEARVEEARAKGLPELADEKAFRLPREERLQRVKALLEGLARLEGGAKLTLHYTDVAPPLVIMAVTGGGNHIFGHILGADGYGRPELKLPALEEALSVFADEILSDVYVGWVRGYLDEEREKLEAWLGGPGEACPGENPGEGNARWKGRTVKIGHPREIIQSFLREFQPEWLE